MNVGLLGFSVEPVCDKCNMIVTAGEAALVYTRIHTHTHLIHSLHPSLPAISAVGEAGAHMIRRHIDMLNILLYYALVNTSQWTVHFWQCK